MTHHEVKVLPDGTRLYSNYTKYVPIAEEDRKYKRRKPEGEGAIRFRGDWFFPLDLIDLEERVMPETRPDSDAYEHMKEKIFCNCDVCKRPEAARWHEKCRREWRS